MGTKLVHKIFRQLLIVDADQITWIEEMLNSFVITVFVPLLMLIGFGGRLLPTWMFVNSLSLLVHLPMISSFIPGNLHFFLIEYLGVLRLHSENLDLKIESW